jgi:hypothetical protein
MRGLFKAVETDGLAGKGLFRYDLRNNEVRSFSLLVREGMQGRGNPIE